MASSRKSSNDKEDRFFRGDTFLRNEIALASATAAILRWPNCKIKEKNEVLSAISAIKLGVLLPLVD